MTEPESKSSDRQHNHLLAIEPEEVVFTSVRLNQVYSQCVRIKNPLSCPVDILIVSGNAERVTLNPSSVHLESHEEVLVEIRLLIRRPIERIAKRTKGNVAERAYREVIHIRSSHFQQKFFVLFTFWGSNPVLTSKVQSGFGKRKPCGDTKNAEETIPCHPHDFECSLPDVGIHAQSEHIRNLEIKLKDMESEKVLLIKELSNLKSERDFFASKSRALDTLQAMLSSEEHPVAAMVDVLLESEREKNEFKSQKILTILKTKDTELELLKADLISKTEEMNSFRKKLDATSCELEDLKAKLRAAEETIASREYDIATQTQSLEALRKDNASLKIDTDRKIMDLQKEKRGLEKRLKTAETKLENTQTFEVLKKQLEEEIESLQQQLSAKHCHYRAELSTAETTIKNLENEIEGLQTVKQTNARLKRELFDLKKNGADCSQELETAKLENDLKIKLLSEKDQEIESLKTRIAMECERSSDQNVQRLEVENAEAKEEILKLQQTIDQLQSLHTKMQTCVLSSELELRRRTDKLKCDPSDKGFFNGKARKAIAIIYQRLWRKKADSEDFKSIISLIHKKLDELDSEIEVTRAKVLSYEAQIRATKIQHIRATAILQCQMRSKDAEIRFLRLKINSRDVYVTEDSFMQDIIQNLENRCKALEDDLNNLKFEEPLENSFIQRLQQHLVKMKHVARKKSNHLVQESDLDSDERKCCFKCNSEIAEENDKLKFENESLSAKICCLEKEIEIERKHAIQAESIIADQRDEWCAVKIGINDASAIDLPECAICKELQALLHDAECQIQRLLQVMPGKITSERGAQHRNSTNGDESVRIRQLEDELHQSKAHASILVQTIEGLQSSQKDQDQHKMNALILTLAAQLSTAKVMESQSDRRFQEICDKLNRTEIVASEIQSTLKHREDENFSLLYELQQSNERRLLIQNELHEERVKNLKNKRRVESCIAFPRKLKAANYIISALRKKLSFQRQLFCDFAVNEKSKSTSDEIAKIDYCSMCREHISNEISEITGRLYQALSQLQDRNPSEYERCVQMMDTLTKAFKSCIEIKFESAKTIRVLEQQHRRDCKTISILNRNLETLQSENEMASALLAALDATSLQLPPKPFKQKINLQNEEMWKNKIVFLEARIQILLQERNQLQSLYDIEKAEHEAQLATVIQKHDESMAEKIRLGLLLNDSILSSHSQFFEREDESSLEKLSIWQMNAFRTVQVQLTERLDSLVRDNRGLSTSIDHYKQLVKSLHTKLRECELVLIQRLHRASIKEESAEGMQNNMQLSSPSSDEKHEPDFDRSDKDKSLNAGTTFQASEIERVDRISQTNIDCPDCPELLGKIKNLQHQNAQMTSQLCAQLSVNSSREELPESTCSLKDASEVKAISQHLRARINNLVISVSNFDVPSINNSGIAHNLKGQAVMICTEWKRLEPKLNALCDERSKLAVGVKMLRKQLKDIQEIRNGSESIISFSSVTGANTECERVRQNKAIQVCYQGERLNQTTQTCTAADCTQIRISTTTQTCDSDFEVNPVIGDALEPLSVPSSHETDCAEKEVQVERCSKSKLFHKKYKSTKVKLDNARCEIRSLNQQVGLLQTKLEQVEQTFAEEKRKMHQSLKQKFELIKQKDVEDATALLKENVEQLNVQLKQEMALHTAQFEALLKEFERYRLDHEQEVQSYENRLAAAVKEKKPHHLSVCLIDPNGDATKMPCSDSMQSASSSCSGCLELKSVQNELEKTRGQLSLANAKCREFRHELQRVMSRSAQQENSPRSIERSRSPSVAADQHEKAIAKLESKLQQCRTHIRSLSSVASASSSAAKEVSELKSKLEALKQTLDDKDRRIKSLLASVAHRDKIIEDLNSRIRSTSELDNDTKDSIRNLQEKLNRSATNLSAKQAVIKDLQEKLKQLETECGQKEMRVESLRHYKSALQKTESIINKIQKELKDSEDCCKTLETKNAELKFEIEQLKETTHRLKKDIKVFETRKEDLEDILKTVSFYLLSCISRLKEESELLSHKSEAIGRVSKELNVDASLITNTLPEFSLLDLHDLLAPTKRKDQNVDCESIVTNLLQCAKNKQQIIDRIKSWIDEKSRLEYTRITPVLSY